MKSSAIYLLGEFGIDIRLTPAVARSNLGPQKFNQLLQDHIVCHGGFTFVILAK